MGSVTRKNYEARLATLLESIKRDSSRETITCYLREKLAEGVKPGTLVNSANALRSLANDFPEKQLEELSRDDITQYATTINRTRSWRNVRNDGPATVTTKEVQLSPATMAIRRTIVKAFYKWFLGDGEKYPDNVRHLKTRGPSKGQMPVDQLITSTDMKALLQAHPDPQDAAILATLLESGLRAGELCALNVGSIDYDEFGAVIIPPLHAEGLKTGSRRVRIFANESCPYLHTWWEAHPRQGNPQAPLFYTRSHRAPGARLTVNALWKFISQAGKRAALHKPIWPHLFRHTAATERARLGWNEAQMRAFFGWSRSSDMPSNYVHLAGQDYEKMELSRRGLIASGDHSNSPLMSLTCKVCEASNLPTATFCQNCRNPVSPEAEQLSKERKRDEIRLFLKEELLSDLRASLAAELHNSAGLLGAVERNS